MNQGAKEFFLGLSGDSTTQTSNGMSDLFYDGNDTIYHLSTGTAAMAGSMLTPYVNAQAAAQTAGTGTAAGSTAGEPAVTKPTVTEAAGGMELVESGTLPRGTLTGKLDGLEQAERKVINELLDAGSDVEIIPRSNIPYDMIPDFLVNGVKTELKTLNGTSLNTPITKIQRGFIKFKKKMKCIVSGG